MNHPNAADAGIAGAGLDLDLAAAPPLLQQELSEKRESDQMKLQDITNMNKNDVLGRFGLEARRSKRTRLLTALGPFGIGLLVGAGVALLLAPKAGGDLRRDLRAKLRRDGKGEVLGTKNSQGVVAVEAASHPA